MATPADYSAQQRAGQVMQQLMLGYELTTAEIAEITGLTRTGAWTMMSKLALLPGVACVDGRWRILGRRRIVDMQIEMS